MLRKRLWQLFKAFGPSLLMIIIRPLLGTSPVLKMLGKEVKSCLHMQKEKIIFKNIAWKQKGRWGLIVIAFLIGLWIEQHGSPHFFVCQNSFATVSSNIKLITAALSLRYCANSLRKWWSSHHQVTPPICHVTAGECTTYLGWWCWFVSYCCIVRINPAL